MDSAQVVLNPDFSFLDHQDKRYGYMATHEFPMAFMALSPELENVLQNFRTPQTLTPVSGAKDSGQTLTEFLSFLRTHGILVPKDFKPAKPWQKPERGVPDSITFLPTTQCNLGCNYCYAEAGDHLIEELPVDLAETAVRKLIAMQPESTKKVSVGFLGGGEPSLRFDLVKSSVELFYELAKERGIKTHVSMVTNGAFSKKFLDWGLKNDIKFSFSLDGPADLQNLQRPLRSGAPSYNRIVDNIRRVAEAQGPVHVRATVTRQGMSRLDEIIEHAESIGANSVHLQPLSAEAGRARILTRSQFALDAKHFVDKFLEVYPQALARGTDLFTTGLLCLRPGNSMYCGAQSPNLMVAPSGNLTACPEYCESRKPGSEDFMYGKVTNAGFEYKEEVMLKLHDRRGDTLKDCANCFIRDQCGGGCMASARDHSNDAFTYDIATCAGYQEMGRRMISAIADERLLPGEKAWLPRKQNCADGNLQGKITTLIPQRSALRFTKQYKPIMQFLKGGPGFTLAPGSSL